MKTKELIRRLQEEDPTGEEEVILSDGSDIFTLESIPGYWDGCYTTLIRDPSKLPYYDIIGAKYRSDGDKIRIRGMNWEDVLWDHPEYPVEVIDTFCAKRMQNEVDKVREEIRQFYIEYNLKKKNRDGENI